MAIAVPWPVADPEQSAAVTALQEEIAGNQTDAQVNRLALMASARIQQYAPDAPAAAKEIALIRYVAYLSQMPSGNLVRMSINNLDLEFRSSTAAAFINSGAAAVISPYKRRRGGLIGRSQTATTSSDTTITPATPEEPEELSMRQQQSHIDLSDTPVDIVVGLTAGTYEFQKSPGSKEAAVVLYAFGNSTPPTDTEDFFILGQDERIVFNTAASCWCRVLVAANPATLAISSI